MADVVYIYPKSSCPTENCRDKYTENKGFKSNLSVRGCKIPSYFTCYDTLELKKDVEPVNDSGIYELNPDVYLSKLAVGFDRVGCKTVCKETPYISLDPRLYSSKNADYLPLDRPPIDGNVFLKDVYDKKYDNYETGFKPYEFIQDGQITYYIDKSIKDAFYKPVYSEPSTHSTVLYKDPMGSMKPEHNRDWIYNTSNQTVKQEPCYPYNLSFLQDSQSFREDIISLQQRKNNQSKWSAMWT